MKKRISLLLALCLVMTIAGCGKKESPAANEESRITVTQTADAEQQKDAPKAIADVCLGDAHTAVLLDNGDLYICGDNVYGQLGQGDSKDKDGFVLAMQQVVSFSMGGGHSAAVTKDGQLYLWGRNDYGQIGNGTTEHAYAPVKIMDNVKSVVLGVLYSTAITENGDLYTWGYNANNELGATTLETDSSGLPISTKPIKILSGVQTVETGSTHCGAITEQGELYLWGNSSGNKLGIAATEKGYYGSPVCSTPVKVFENVAAISLGNFNTAFFTNDGTMYYAGGVLENDSAYSKSTEFMQMSFVEGTAAIELSDAHHGLITQGGELYVWGLNRNYALAAESSYVNDYGNGYVTNPTCIMQNVRAVRFGYAHTAALTKDGRLFVWGLNSEGQLGVATKGNEPAQTPVEITLSMIVQ